MLTDLVGEEVTREAMPTLRADLAEISARLEAAEERAELLPHREQYLRIVIDFLREYLELHSELIERVEREFAAEPAQGSRN
jgi:hypothetical protein